MLGSSDSQQEFLFTIRVCVCVDLFQYVNFPQNKMNLFVLSGHGSDSFAAFLNGVILKKQRSSDHCSCHHNTSRECFKI